MDSCQGRTDTAQNSNQTAHFEALHLLVATTRFNSVVQVTAITLLVNSWAVLRKGRISSYGKINDYNCARPHRVRPVYRKAEELVHPETGELV